MEDLLSRAQKPPKKLRKSLRVLGSEPSAGEVHKLRTQAARLVAESKALKTSGKRARKRLWSAVSPVRKAAGNVRDMDVLVEKVLGLAHGLDEECRVRLVEQLSARRLEGAAALHDLVKQRRKDARKELKKYRIKVEAKTREGYDTVSAAVAGTAAQLRAKLAQWPTLDAGNVHDFRKKVKGLRYTLEIMPRADERLLNHLGEVKDRIGEWHDWHVMVAIAEQVLDHGTGCPLLREIRREERASGRTAITAGNKFRKRWLGTAVA